MNKHDHHACQHTNLAYCDHCRVVYCKDCGKEWREPAPMTLPSVWQQYRQNDYHPVQEPYTLPYHPDTVPPRWNILCGNDSSSASNIGPNTCTHRG